MKKQITTLSGLAGRIVSYLLCAFLSLTSLVACGSSESEGAKLVFTTGFAKDEVFQIGEESCSLPELMVYLATVQNQYEAVYGAEIWNVDHDGQTLAENVKETVLARIAQIKTMVLLAESKGVALDDEEESKVLDAAASYYASLNDTERSALGVSEETCQTLYHDYALADKVYREIIRDINPEISDDEARKITVQHIYLSTSSTDAEGNVVPYSESMMQAQLATANEVHALAVDGEHDFTELASKYSEDSEITFSFAKGEMESAYEEAAFALATDEISDVVSCRQGVYIIKCISTLDREETDANKEKIVKQRRQEAFGEEYDSFVESLVRRCNEELFAEVDLIDDPSVDTSNFFDLYAEYFPEES